jgi:hypothetical protein
MAKQIKTDELEGCKSYLTWLREKSDISSDLSRFLFETDFEWSVDEDEIRVRDALELRKIYADEVGAAAEKSKRDIDRIWKTIYGKCSVFELLISMAKHIDQMVNEGEDDSMIPDFMKIFVDNVGWSKKEDEAHWKTCTDHFMSRKYHHNGSHGGIFIVHDHTVHMEELGLWKQLNVWLNEHLDENGEYIGECK